jgi:hypothetical protein
MPVFFPDLPPDGRKSALEVETTSKTASCVDLRGSGRASEPQAGSRQRNEVSRGGSGGKVKFEDQPLSAEQKWRLSELAEKVFLHRFQNTVGAIPSDKSQRAKAVTAFRHEQCEIAVGVRISEALQKHFNDLKAHFEALMGESGAAFGTLMREHTNGQRQAWHKLHIALKERGLDENYAGAIARSQFKKELSGLSEKQLWCVFFTITNRRSKGGAVRRQAPAKRVGPKSPSEQIAAVVNDADIPF